MQNSILTDIASLKIRNNIDFANNKLSTTLKRMGSGYKVLNAKDDAAGCVIASKTNAKLSILPSTELSIYISGSFSFICSISQFWLC